MKQCCIVSGVLLDLPLDQMSKGDLVYVLLNGEAGFISEEADLPPRAIYIGLFDPGETH